MDGEGIKSDSFYQLHFLYFLSSFLFYTNMQNTLFFTLSPFQKHLPLVVNPKYILILVVHHLHHDYHLPICLLKYVLQPLDFTPFFFLFLLPLLVILSNTELPCFLVANFFPFFLHFFNVIVLINLLDKFFFRLIILVLFLLLEELDPNLLLWYIKHLCFPSFVFDYFRFFLFIFLSLFLFFTLLLLNVLKILLIHWNLYSQRFLLFIVLCFGFVRQQRVLAFQILKR